MRDSGEDFGQIAFEPDEDGLRFRVAEADVVFEHARARGCKHQADEEDAAKGEPVRLRARERRFDDLAGDAPACRIVEHSWPGARAPAAAVRACGACAAGLR